ncbi:HCP oxidoreductase, NADH-dependent [Escherichia coli]|uniref:HCP oxidoreductase, NADH-dependent n=1 Tax=Escherichia coli TaxID=562 RepID=A0A376UCG3_ECOLX|nr:HCP oxidoreductase, NADH-dependent [Escherichia coli]
MLFFADEWRNYPVTLVAENNVTEGFIAGRLTRELLAGVPDLASRYRDDLRPGSVYGLGRAGSESARRDAFL